jgi:hypothetical protein
MNYFILGITAFNGILAFANIARFFNTELTNDERQRALIWAAINMLCVSLNLGFLKP